MSDELSQALREVRERLTGIEEQLRILARIEEKTVMHHEQLVQLFTDRDSMSQKLHALELEVTRSTSGQLSTRNMVKLILTVLTTALASGLTVYFTTLKMGVVG